MARPRGAQYGVPAAHMWTEILLVLRDIALAYVFLNIAAFVCNRCLRLPFRPRSDFTSEGTLLVVVAHQDDELIIAGGAMARTLYKGGDVHVVYTVDGVTRHPSLTEGEAQKRIARRESESLACLADLGIPRQNAHFLRYENEEGLTKLSNVDRAVNQVAQLIEELDPYGVVTSAFEGGHPDHDMTHFIVSRAAQAAGFALDRVFEAPEYNRFYRRGYFLRKLNEVLLIKFGAPPRFLPSTTPSFALDMSRGEIARKRSLFRHFKTQKPRRLTRRFGFPDQFRLFSRPDYAKGPYDPRDSLRYRLVGPWRHNRRNERRWFEVQASLTSTAGVVC